ncbi:MAG: two-component sensor histidine kinase, partial [Spirochaetaceae bacterium]|nr:two-component sensor histidine kinase [Spirochaetaceae bacterium]
IFSVQDYGTGITEEKISSLFRIDEMKSTKGTNSEKGTGFGLILCKEFIDCHGGTISVESQLGKGSVFTVTLPHSPEN